MADEQDKVQTVRIGFIGAGGIAQSRHLPGLQKIEGARLVAVANRSLQSSRRVTAAYGGEAMEDWRALVAREDIDAVFIGTWPYMHKEMSIAALEAGKHVFCQARMAMDLEEAKAMHEAAKAHPLRVNMICPPPTRMPFEPYIKQLLAEGSLGTITSVELKACSNANLDARSFTWREDIRYSGRQIMMVGIFAETLNAWVGPYDSLSATTDIPLRRKKDDQGRDVLVEIPQVVQIQGRLRGGVPISELHHGLIIDPKAHKTELVIWGLDGALRYTFGDSLELARPGQGFKRVKVPAKLQRPWQVEADFIAAVRLAMQGRSWKVSPDFAEGLLYMRKMQAIYESAKSGKAGTPIDPAAL